MTVRRPPMTVADRYGLSGRPRYTPIPDDLFRTLVRLRLQPAESLVTLACLAFWIPTDGNRFGLSLTRLAALVGIERTYLSRVVKRLGEKGVLGVFCEHGKTTQIDVTPLLAHLRRTGHPTVALVQQTEAAVPVPAKLLRGSPKVLHRNNSTVAPGSGTVVSAGSKVQPKSKSNNQSAEGAVESSAGGPASTAPGEEQRRQHILDTLAALDAADRKALR